MKTVLEGVERLLAKLYAGIWNFWLRDNIARTSGRLFIESRLQE